MQLTLGAKIDLHPQRVLDIELQTDDVQQRGAGKNINEQVEVAPLAVEALKRRSEHANVACAARGGDAEHACTMPREGF